MSQDHGTPVKDGEMQQFRGDSMLQAADKCTVLNRAVLYYVLHPDDYKL